MLFLPTNKDGSIKL